MSKDLRLRDGGGPTYEKIRCAEASLDGVCLSQVDHTHTVDTTLSGMYRAIVTAIAAYEYDTDLV